MKGNDDTINRISYDFEKVIISAGQSNCEVFWFGWGGWGDTNMQLLGVGKLNGWVLKLNFADQIIFFKSLF